MGVDPGGWEGCTPLEKMWGITYAIYPLRVGLPPDKNTKFVVTTWVLSSSECTKTRFRPGLRPGPRWGSLRRSPRSLSRLGRGTPSPPFPPPWRLRRLDLAAIPPSSKRNLRQCICLYLCKHDFCCPSSMKFCWFGLVAGMQNCPPNHPASSSDI